MTSIQEARIHNYSYTVQTSETDFDTIESCKIDLLVSKNDIEFLFQVYMCENEFSVSIPDDYRWGTEEHQRYAYENYSAAQIESELEDQGIELNPYFISENFATKVFDE